MFILYGIVLLCWWILVAVAYIVWYSLVISVWIVLGGAAVIIGFIGWLVGLFRR